MADIHQDDVEKKLAALCRLQPIADDGFNARTMSRLRRQIWIRRLMLPLACAIGLAISLKPLSQLTVTFSKVLLRLLNNVTEQAVNIPPSYSMIFSAVLLTLFLWLTAKLLADKS